MSEREEFPMKRILLVVALAFGLGVIVGCGGGTDTKATKKTEPTKSADGGGTKNGKTPDATVKPPEEKKSEEKKEDKKSEETKEDKKNEEKKEDKKNEEKK
jgi:hypothetical protein